MFNLWDEQSLEQSALYAVFKIFCVNHRVNLTDCIMFPLQKRNSPIKISLKLFTNCPNIHVVHIYLPRHYKWYTFCRQHMVSTLARHCDPRSSDVKCSSQMPSL